MTDKEAVQKLEKDREIMRKKQVCIGFGPKMHSFPILVPGRFLIHEGEVTVIEKKKKKKIWLMLFSDILLLTRKNGRILTCTEQPLMMDSLIISDINISDATEFQLVLVEGTFSRLVRASSVAVRDEWVELLKERVSSNLAYKKVSDKGRCFRIPDRLRRHSQVAPSTLAVDAEPEASTHNLIDTIPESSPSTVTLEKQTETGKMDLTSKFRRSMVKSKPSSSAAGAEAFGHSDLEPLKRGASKRRSLFSGKKIEQGESGLEASGTSSAKDVSKAKKKNKKKSTAVSPGASKACSPVEEPLSYSSIPVDVLQTWETSFSSLLADPDGVKLFEAFLKTEFSEENLHFYKACEKFKELPDDMIPAEAALMYKDFIDPQAAKLVNIDHHTSKGIKDLRDTPTRTMFQEAQQSIYLLMARDSFARFIKSEPFQTALLRE